MAELAIRRFGWPGNVRQLENHIKKALVMADREAAGARRPGTCRPSSLTEILPLADAKERYARKYVLDTLALCGGNRTRAAQLLGVDPRTVFRFLEREDSSKPE
jgi:DNA-binding NtrC family response regulator